jgi:hypothetical protein
MMNRLLAPPETVGLLPYGAAVVPVRAGEWPRQLTLDGSPVRLPDAAEQAEAARFFAKVVADPRPGGCRHWIGAIGDDGYGRFRAGRGPTSRTVRAHRWAHEYASGLRPLRWPLLHSCDETGCVAVEHLLVGSPAQNVAQMHGRGRGGRRHVGLLARERGLRGGVDLARLGVHREPVRNHTGPSNCQGQSLLVGRDRELRSLKRVLTSSRTTPDNRR